VPARATGDAQFCPAKRLQNGGAVPCTENPGRRMMERCPAGAEALARCQENIVDDSNSQRPPSTPLRVETPGVVLATVESPALVRSLLGTSRNKASEPGTFLARVHPVQPTSSMTSPLAALTIVILIRRS
jgi:hypothetical protein